jgi:hypothetical protein
VFPAHSFKFAAALQRAQGSPAPVLIRIETRAGHGLEQADRQADRRERRQLRLSDGGACCSIGPEPSAAPGGSHASQTARRVDRAGVRPAGRLRRAGLGRPAAAAPPSSARAARRSSSHQGGDGLWPGPRWSPSSTPPSSAPTCSRWTCT